MSIERHTFEELDRVYSESKVAAREPMTSEEIEIVTHELFTKIANVNILCNSLLNRPAGLPIAVIHSMHNIKAEISHIKWFLEHRDDGRP